MGTSSEEMNKEMDEERGRIINDKVAWLYNYYWQGCMIILWIFTFSYPQIKYTREMYYLWIEAGLKELAVLLLKDKSLVSITLDKQIVLLILF